MDLKQISEFEWEMPKTGSMLVSARVFASKPLLEVIKGDRTLEQLHNMTHLPGIQKYAIALADAHQGYGVCIGGVVALSRKNGAISPGAVGYDINCGVRLMRTNLKKEDVLPKVRELIDDMFSRVPCGIGRGGAVRVTPDELREVLSKGSKWALKQGFATQRDLDHTEEKGCLDYNDAKIISDKAIKRGLNQLGSLGSGNHFLEIQYVQEVYDEKVAKEFGIEKDNIVVMIHCGSRGLGHQVASDYLRKMENAFPDIVKSLPDRELIYAPAGNDLADEYFKAMNCAANFAWCNRQIIMHNVRKSFEAILGKPSKDMGMELVYDVCHNIAKVETYDNVECYIHRKGATRSFPGQPVLIPGDMANGSYLMVGSKGAMTKTFGSTAHGAGRVMSRHKAKKLFPSDQVMANLRKQGIYLKSASRSGVSEEAPGVYKDIDEVVRVSHELDLAKRVARLKPLGVIIG